MSRHTGQRQAGLASASSTFSPMRISRQLPHHCPRPRPPGGARVQSPHGHRVFRSSVFCLRGRGGRRERLQGFESSGCQLPPSNAPGLRTGKSGTTSTTCSPCRRRAAACTTACPGARRGPTALALETLPGAASGRACSTPDQTACAGCAPTQAPGGLQPRDGPPRSCATEAHRHAQPWRRAALPDVRAGAGASCARSTPGRGRMCLTYGTTVVRFSDTRTQGTIQRHSEAQVSQAHGSSDGGGVQASHGQPTPSLKT